MKSVEGRARGAHAAWTVASSLVVWLFLVYLAIVLPVDRVFPAMNELRVALVLLVTSFAGIFAVLRYVAVALPAGATRVKDVLLLAVMSLLAFLGADIGFTAYTNVNEDFRIDQERLFKQRTSDPQAWNGEILPIAYEPTRSNFRLYKPLQEKAGVVYGEHYYRSMLEHALLKDSVLELSRIEYVIDAYGLRSRTPPQEAVTFALGDSFCFGYSVTQEEVFSERLSALTGDPVYNLGISSTSPLQQLLLLEYLLKTHPDAFRPKRLLWMFFEGNDLTETYDERGGTEAQSKGLREIFAGTLVETVADLPGVIRRQSMVRLATSGDISFAGAVHETQTNHFELDGKPLAYPLYGSDKYGYAIFRQAYLEQAAQSEEEVLQHPNWPKLVATYQRMKDLADRHGFEVTVVLIPTKVRLYHTYFADMPPVASRSFLSERVRELSGELGFAVVDLVTLLQPFADQEFIYRRDDTHWNGRGHELVARLLAREVYGIADEPTPVSFEVTPGSSR